MYDCYVQVWGTFWVPQIHWIRLHNEVEKISEDSAARVVYRAIHRLYLWTADISYWQRSQAIDDSRIDHDPTETEDYLSLSTAICSCRQLTHYYRRDCQQVIDSCLNIDLRVTQSIDRHILLTTAEDIFFFPKFDFLRRGQVGLFFL